MPMMNYDKQASSKEEPAKKDATGLLDQVQAWQGESKRLMDIKQQRWAQNMKMMKGIWDVDEKSRSQIRGRSKIYFRKIWSAVWRLMASVYNSFLRDSQQFKITGRCGDDLDVHRAGVLQICVEYYRDMMMRTQHLFVQHLWGIHDTLTHGFGVGLFSWEFNKGKKIDRPRFDVFPPERVFPDLTATLPGKMKFIIFEGFHTKDEMKEKGYINIDDLQAVKPETGTLANVRNGNSMDPIQNPGEHEYPTPGRYVEGEGKDDQKSQAKDCEIYRVWQVFYKKGDSIWFAVTSGSEAILQPAAPSKYGDVYPVVMGSCLLEPHKLMGEGFPEPLEGPQISLNDTINRRKDNVHLVMNKHKIVDRYANVDLSSLMNSRAGGITLADTTEAVKELEHGDVTQSAYVEAGADEGMIQEMSGVTSVKQGMDKSSKATTSQINLTESNAKIDLFMAIIGQTWFMSFYQILTYMVQRFMTDEKVLRIANQSFRQKFDVGYDKMPNDIKDLDDFDADIIVDCGIGSISRDMEIRDKLMAMDRAVMANQSIIALVSTGAVPLQKVKLFDTTKFMEDILPLVGTKNVKDYFFEVMAPPPEQPGQGAPGQPGGGPMARLSGAMQPPTKGGAPQLNSLMQFMRGTPGQ